MQIDHVLIRTSDLTTMEKFFEQTIRLKPGPRPPFSFDGSWLYSEGKALIHLAASSSHGTDGAIDHIAFTGDSYPNLINRLRTSGHQYVEHTVPKSGERRIFVKGPEGITLEIQFPPEKKES